ncbi:LLM class flavin-dependent oxidoreductase [Acidihalobacter ferrooxydans]|uniref:Monooxygenase n=1 Tax=Acidihalobacter ferrooxydans TaxID=1765967 RepID=A0A1P8UFB8_9GAMM|nr:LLM class flavin-dependent oxidoreductase [Acidihalobacter ferrooxydans]APZ42454.1 monooxygenase [Acidihalobacter ferrooxydans]
MHFDLFNELSVPDFADRRETEVFSDTLDLWTLAETLGFTTGWLVEHHFMPEYSHSTAPALFLAAASQRTRRLRLGHAIVPLPYHHPIQVAERLATLDVLSGGRVDFGYGRGFSPIEYAAFGRQMRDSRSYTAESLDIIRQALATGEITHHGRHFDFDGLRILPHAVQRPHPPIWAAAVSPESFELAAQAGVGVLVGPFKPWFMVREDIRRYHDAWQRHHGNGAPRPDQNRRIAMTVGIHCHADHRTARREARDAFVWFYRHLLGQTRAILEQLYEGYEYYRRFGKLGTLAGKAISLSVLETLGMTLVGDPAHCRKRLRELREAGVDHVLCAFGAGVMPRTQTEAGMRLFAEQVMPEFARSTHLR